MENNNEIALLEISPAQIDSFGSIDEMDVVYNDLVIKTAMNLSYMINHEMYLDIKDTVKTVSDALELLALVFNKTLEVVEVDVTDCLEAIPAYNDIQQEKQLVH